MKLLLEYRRYGICRGIQGWEEDGQGTETLSSGWKYVGEWREGKPWNITIYGKSGIIIMKYVNGVEQK